MALYRMRIAFVIAAAALPIGHVLADEPGPAETPPMVVYCYDGVRDIVSRVLTSQRHSAAVDETEAKEIEEHRNRHIARALNFQQSGSAAADGVFLPASALDRDQTITVIYRLYKPIAGEGRLHVEWTDADGRVVERRDIPLKLDHASDVTFPIDLRRAVATSNTLHTHFVFDEIDENGVKTHREKDDQVEFAVRPVNSAWLDYQIVMWQSQTPAQYRALKAIGVTAGEVHLPNRAQPDKLPEDEIASLRHSGLRWYVENIATDFYSTYHRWFPDQPKNWRFEEVKKLYKQNPSDPAAFYRDPSLSAPKSLNLIRDRLTRTVRAERSYRPLFYNLGDETGIAELSIPWDFDLSKPSLAGMRAWLKKRYGTLDVLNRQWGSNFSDWKSVMPMTTDQAIARADDNFSAWADFKEWMDEAFARAIRSGTDAVHAADPKALAAIEGAQIPGWGGYDYSRLATAVDVMELYDGGGNLEIVRSLNPKMIVLTTSFDSSPMEAHRVWRELLRGSRGLILWDPNSEFANDDGSLGRRGRDAAPYFREIRSGLGALLINSERQFDPVAILYSPASLRTQWLLDWKPKGDTWATRDIKDSYEDANEARSSFEGFANLLEHMGVHPRVLTDALIEHGALEKYRILVLPHALALAPGEADTIRKFVEKGGTVIADVEPGIFDGHSRKLATPLLSDVFAAAETTGRFGAGKAILFSGAEACSDDPATEACRNSMLSARRRLEALDIKPALPITTVNDEALNTVETYAFRNGNVTILALQHDLPASESAEARDASLGGSAVSPVALALPGPAFLYDLRQGKALGSTARLELALDPIAPTILAISDKPLPAPTIQGPRQLRLGQTGRFSFGFATASPAAFPVLHAEVTDPSGKIIDHYSGNLIAPGGAASLSLPLALNDPAGTWRIRVTDLLSGQTATMAVQVSGS
jgi:hypothetical protein